MRSVLLSLVLALAACNNSAMSTPEDFAAPQDLSIPDDMTNMLTCSATCSPACGTGTTCVAQGSSITFFRATCLASCSSQLDCTGGRMCVDIYGATPSGRYCLSTTEPQECGTHCDLTPAVSYCSGSDIASAYQGVVCGAKFLHCANGCVEDAPDGGVHASARCL